MLISKFLRALLVAGILAFSSSTYASTTTEYDYGVIVAKQPWDYVPPSPLGFAHLEVIDDGAGSSDFTLTIFSNLFSNFGSSAYVRGMGFDYSFDATPAISNVSSSVVGATATYHDGWPVPGMTVDFGTVFSNGSLGDNAWIKWTASGLGVNNTLRNSYVYVYNINGNPASYAKYAAVPEPETYAMLLLGLGMLGLTRYRRKKAS